MSKERGTDDLPDAPDAFTCSITYCRMTNPVMTVDGHSYERSAIEEWFKHKNTSPKTGLALDSKALLPNLTLKTQIKEWVDDQLKGRADKESLTKLKGKLVNVDTSKEGQVVVQQMIQLITSSNFCLLSPDGVERLKNIIDGFKLLDSELIRMFDLLCTLCQSEINTKQEMHRELNKKCNVLDLAKTTIINQEDDFKNMVVKTKIEASAAKKKIPAATKLLRDAQANFDKVNQDVVDTKEEHEKAEENLVEYKKRVIDHSKLCSEYLNERDNLERQLEGVGSMEEVQSGSSSSSSSSSPLLPAGSKRGRSSSSSSSSSTRGSKRAKKEKDGVMEMHPGQWLYEEGMAYLWGLDFKKINPERGQLMIEVSASSGFPMAVACCHLNGWNGLKWDRKKAFDMFVRIEKETNGYHWAQFSLGQCYEYGYGVGKDEKKIFKYYSLSAEQGTSVAMNNLAYCYSQGKGTDVNKTKAFEWYEKSANLGLCYAMNNVGSFYQHGLGGVTKDVNTAKQWYTKAAAQGYTDAQTALDKLNAQ